MHKGIEIARASFVPMNLIVVFVADTEAVKRRKGKVPDRKKCDEEIEVLMGQISEKESQLVRSSMTLACR